MNNKINKKTDIIYTDKTSSNSYGRILVIDKDVKSLTNINNNENIFFDNNFIENIMKKISNELNNIDIKLFYFKNDIEDDDKFFDKIKKIIIKNKINIE